MWGFGVVFHNQSDHDTSLSDTVSHCRKYAIKQSSQSYPLCSLIPNSILGNRCNDKIKFLAGTSAERLLCIAPNVYMVLHENFSQCSPLRLTGCYTTLETWAVNRGWSSFAESQITTRILTWWLCDCILASAKDGRNALLILPISIIGLAIRAKANVKNN